VLRSKTLFLFLLKSILIYSLLSLPFSFFDEAYGNFYRKVAKTFFGNFRDGGFVAFEEGKQPAITHINVGIYAFVRPDGSCDTAVDDINTRYLGYIPTILLISLVLASPVPWRRRLIALVAGLFLVTMLILFKQWISLLWLCEINMWLKFPHFTGVGKKVLTFFINFIAVSSSTLLYFVVAIWLLVTFRVEDFKAPKLGKVRNHPN
jgi:hypothetical protein